MRARGRARAIGAPFPAVSPAVGESLRGYVDRTVPAIVLKFDRNVFHHGGLGVIRSLGRLGVPVYGVHEDRWAPAGSSRYLHGRWLWPAAGADTDRRLSGLAALAARIGRPSVLIPTDDAAAIFIAEHADQLPRELLVPAPPATPPRVLADKHALHGLCARRGLPTVQSVLVDGAGAAERFAAEVGLPVVVKLARPWAATSRALPSTSIVPTRDALSALVGHAARGGAVPLLMQEHVPGGAGADWFVHGYADATSRCRPIFIGRKERAYPSGAGLTCLGRAVRNDRLRRQAEDLVAALGYRGIFDLDLRYDGRRDSYLLLDFNPRIGAQFRLFEDGNGLDVARAAHLDLTGRPVPVGAPRPGRGFVVENYDLLTVLGMLRRGEVDGRGWVRSLRGVEETAWFARDDLAPFGLMCLRSAWRAVERPLRRRSAAPPSPYPTVPAPRFSPGRAGHRRPPRPVPAGKPAPAGKEVRPVPVVDVAVVGAGPYGLSVAAHLRAAGTPHRVFGLPMHSWESAMPAGMHLKSQGFASNLSDPARTSTLEAFCRQTGRAYAPYGRPVPLADFVAYGRWFQRCHVPDLDELTVDRLERAGRGFVLTLTGGEEVAARAVVVAAGISHFAYLPPVLAALPASACTHSGAHPDLSVFAGQDVLVVGAGQSAL
ncbi:MAG TPA: SidA/IucD/PvdA family monooxygenase, partial [Frankiaceae bacterium]|nr:SidA/IucD/PvdA family monooxygenase [Frankiaceae bacterium]